MMHERFLLAALEQAKLGRGMCAPNPSVGAVAVRNGEIIAQSWHRGAGTPHAEQLLLEKLMPPTDDICLYVTLEPCNHWGKTPPCVEAIIRHGIKKVVYAYSDPNPLVASNNTPKIFAEHGVEAKHFPIPEVDAFYQSYHHWMLTRMPWVSVKMAQSLDGKVSGDLGKRVVISNECCGAFTHQQRLHSDILLTTARTINNDNPLLNVRLPHITCKKPVAIIEGREAIREDALIFETAQEGLVYYAQNASKNTCASPFNYYPVPSNSSGVSLQAVLKHLGALGYHDVWVEAGARLFSALHEAKLVQRTYLYIAPLFLGENARSLLEDAYSFSGAHSINWRIMEDNMLLTVDWSME